MLYWLFSMQVAEARSLPEYAAAQEKKEALEAKIDPERMKKPSFLMVLTGVGPYAYKREDGVYVVPIGCLKD